MSLPACIIPMLAKLIPRLATDHDGEVVATVRAIHRTLKSEGSDFHALAAAVTTPPRVVERIVERPASQPPPGSKGKPETWAELAEWCKARSAKLSRKEHEFVRDMASKLWGNDEPTDRQGAWLRSIYARLNRAAT